MHHLVVSDSVDNRVDAAAEKHHDDGEVIEGAREGVDVLVAEVEHQVVRLVPRPAEHEEQRHGRQRLDHVRSSVDYFVSTVDRLKPCTCRLVY